MKHHEIDNRIVELTDECDDGNMTFAVIEAPHGLGYDTAKPLMVIVHPGDALECPDDWGTRKEGLKVMRFAMKNQEHMGREIEDCLGTHDVVVLHRSSSTQLIENRFSEWVSMEYFGSLDAAHAQGAILFGDDLPTAAKWIIDHALTPTPGQPSRPHVFMTGAYAAAKHGCLTAIGKAIEAHAPGLPISVSEWSPTDNSNHSPRWQPSHPLSDGDAETPAAPRQKPKRRSP